MISSAMLACVASPSGEWDPRSIPDMVSDFDARFSYVLSGATVTSWDAAKGLAYQFGNGGTAPQYEAAGWVGTRRTSPTIFCTGLNDTLISTNTVGGIPLAQRLLGGTDQPGTILMPFQLTSTAANFALLAFTKTGLTATDQRIVLAARLAADNIYRFTKVDDALTTVNVDSTAVPDNNKHPLLAYRHSGTALTVRLDNALLAPASSPPGSQDVGAMTVDRVEIAASYGGAPADMRTPRVIFYSRALSDAELDLAYAGLNYLYG